MACLTLVLVVAAARANAQTGTPSSQQPSAAAAADFPEESESDRRSGNAGYVAGNIGTSVTSDTSSPAGEVESGFRLSKRISVFGAYGFVRNLQPSTYQPYVDIAVGQIAKRNIGVSGEAREPTQYAWGGLRIDIPSALHVLPHVKVGAGWARSTPTADFTYTAGSATVNGGTASAGQSATGDVLSTGVFVGDGWNAMMFKWAAGLSIPIHGAWGIEGEYSWSRMFAPNAVTTQGLTVGLTFRF